MIIALVGVVLISNQKVNAQTEGFELGLRGGWASGIDFAMPLGSNRLHAYVGFGSHLSIDALYDWKITIIGDGFSFILE